MLLSISTSKNSGSVYLSCPKVCYLKPTLEESKRYMYGRTNILEESKMYMYGRTNILEESIMYIYGCSNILEESKMYIYGCICTNVLEES